LFVLVFIICSICSRYLLVFLIKSIIELPLFAIKTIMLPITIVSKFCKSHTNNTSVPIQLIEFVMWISFSSLIYMIPYKFDEKYWSVVGLFCTFGLTVAIELSKQRLKSTNDYQCALLNTLVYGVVAIYLKSVLLSCICVASFHILTIIMLNFRYQYVASSMMCSALLLKYMSYCCIFNQSDDFFGVALLFIPGILIIDSDLLLIFLMEKNIVQTKNLLSTVILFLGAVTCGYIYNINNNVIGFMLLFGINVIQIVSLVNDNK